MQELSTKEHDEARQGEAFAPFAVDANAYKKHFYIESYGCAMNFADSEVVASILHDSGFGPTKNAEEADVIFINTCSIRDKAEQTVRKRLQQFRGIKRQRPNLVVGVLGCMAERLKAAFLEEEKLVDIVVGPDAYRTLPGLLEEAESGQKGVNVLLSRDETYADIAPVRLNSNGVTAFVSIMRGCNNMCSFCVVPFTRGRERSRDAGSIIKECTDLFNQGYREVTLLGQNVDSYYQAPSISPSGGGKTGEISEDVNGSAPGQSSQSSAPSPSPQGRIGGAAVTFALLMEKAALISPLLRVRFSTSHPKDITDDVLHTIARYENICNYIHLPVQSGSSRVLQLMNRTYSREWYIAKVNRIKEIIPDCGLSTDMITGFCTETEEEHQESLSLMEYCKYDLAYMYFYSERPGTLAARRFADDIPEAIKKRRLQEMIDLHRIQSLQSMQREVGKTRKVLIEGTSKKNDTDFYGRTDQNKVVVFAKGDYKLGDYVTVKIIDCTAGTLIGTPSAP
ncbi:MiaB/RimO family radical SAM methylthiotransferase [Ferruginibacter sp.]|nr:tRNA (N6-isopentenyl adenosine(37)-C2)-methylthiotransferase MiaB [Ferruginibacter sp.]